MKKGGKFSVISAEHAAVPFRSPTVRVHSCRFGFQAKRDASTAMIDTSSRPLHKASITNIAFLSFLFALTALSIRSEKIRRKKQESETTSISACNLPPPQSAEWVLPVRETCIFILSDHLIRIKAAWRRRKRLRHHQLSRKETAGGLKNPGLTISIFDDIVVSKQ